ncbi:S41 family peptidase [uncultured Dokdonia sp.]|uniref:S41 family peptidase n=1 Tax=uncultured Dokdonia sp. TaxID=575653 RepID=UPI0026385043|nr:S41 family peptidase [uncultured Dokdonia sp.]
MIVQFKMMKSSIAFLIICLIIGSCKSSSQEEVIVETASHTNSIAILDSIIQISKTNAYNTKNVNWDILSKDMFAISERHDSIDKIGKPTEYMFKTLGDFHGMLMYDYKVAFSYKPEKEGVPRDSIWDAITTTKITLPYEVIGKIIENTNIAYIEIVGTGVMQEEDIIQARDTIRSVICSLKIQEPNGWILDLRCNTGGNMHPMMAGIGELIPDADLGGDTTDDISFDSLWSLKDGNFLENGYAHYGQELQCSETKNTKKIVVLTSRFTASAGEVVASSLKGQDNIVLIGEKTAGLSSTNGWYVLPEKWVLAPMQAYFMSLDKTVHKDGINPDIIVNERLDLSNLFQGKMIERAIKWIHTGS